MRGRTGSNPEQVTHENPRYVSYVRRSRVLRRDAGPAGSVDFDDADAIELISNINSKPLEQFHAQHVAECVIEFQPGHVFFHVFGDRAIGLVSVFSPE